MNSKSERVLKGALAGALGGLAASFAMNQFQGLWTKLAGKTSNGSDATVKTAQAISPTVFQRELSEDQKKWAGPAVHYGFGTLVGAAYGALAEAVPKAGVGRGTGYGSAVWLAADELVLPRLGLTGPAREQPVSTHVQAWLAHVVYGVTTDMARRVMLGMPG
ncbi:MAG TPA: DUF1440 domain-containing protein [Bryobacteraceae bacterium]|nr:DUF1440 domain-containing protein [Bryobacteraceae bacterium]